MGKIKAGTKVKTDSGFKYLTNSVDPFAINAYWLKNPQRRKTYARRNSNEFDVAYLPTGGDWDKWL